MFATEDLFTKSDCVVCQQEIPGIGIECSECPKVRICAECFGHYPEVGSHHPSHKYHFFDCSGGVVIFPPQPGSPASAVEPSPWTTREHIRLLDAIEQYGFGNWQDISKYVETRTAAESKAEYVKRFVCGTIGQMTWNNCPERVGPPVDTTTSDSGPLSPSWTQRLAPLEISDEEAGSLGYMHKRDDYEKEYDNEAEKLVSQLVFSPDDEDVDVSLKLALVDMYSRRLRERVRRKRVIRDYQLVSTFFKKDKNVGTKRRFLKYEKEMAEVLRPFAQFHTSREHEHFLRNLVKEKEIMFRIQELFKYRRAGITCVDECVEYERFKKKTSPARPGDPPTKLGVIAEETPRGHDRVTQDQMQNLQSSATSHFSSQNEGSVGGPNFVVRSPTLKPSFSADINSSSVESPSDLPTSRRDPDHVPENSHPPTEESVDTDDQSTADLNLVKTGYLLSTRELDLCHQTSLEPEQYLTVKTALLLEPARNIPFSNRSPLTSSEWEKIKTYMDSNGWIENLQPQL